MTPTLRPGALAFCVAVLRHTDGALVEFCDGRGMDAYLFRDQFEWPPRFRASSPGGASSADGTSESDDGAVPAGETPSYDDLLLQVQRGDSEEQVRERRRRVIVVEMEDLNVDFL